MKTMTSSVGDVSYAKRICDGHKLIHKYVAVSDGTKLSTFIYLPTKDGRTEENVPAVLYYTPYDPLYFREENGKKILVQEDDFTVMHLLPYGYAVVFVQCRGTGASFGCRKVVCSRQEAEDGAEMVEWIAAQDFCNGKVMTVGMSYNGQTQLEIISCKPKHLVASYVGKTDFNRYDGWVRNGVARAFGSQPDVIWGGTPEEIQKTIDTVVARTKPVDDDPDGILLRQAVAQHVDNGLQIPAMRDLKWRDSYSADAEGKIWEILSASTYLNDMNDSKVAVYIDGGCIDVFKRDTIMLYKNITLPKKMIIGPWDHIGPKNSPEPWTEMLRWGDYWLKGIDNGVMKEKNVAVRVMNYNFETENYWDEGSGYYRYEDDWQVQAGSRKRMYMSDTDRDQKFGEFTPLQPVKLLIDKTVSGEQKYRTVMGVTSSVESFLFLENNERSAFRCGLNYITEPFDMDKEIIGHPMMKISFRLVEKGNLAKENDLDFFVALSDYDPEKNQAFQFCNGWIRSSLRAENECPYDFQGLPWHENKIGSNQYLEKGEKYNILLDLVPSMYRIKKGHQLLVTIVNSQARTYYHGRAAFEEDPDVKCPLIEMILSECYLDIPNIYE